jgi:hypothetical protein
VVERVSYGGEEFVVVEEVVEEFVRVVKEWSRGRRKEGRKKIYFVTFCEFCEKCDNDWCVEN